MKVLFICRANVGRSQAAEALFTSYYGPGAASAGTKVDLPGQQLKARPGAEGILTVMRERGIDMSEQIRTQLTTELAAPFDRLIVMAEPDTMPDWLIHHPRLTMWQVPDPKGQDVETTRRIVDDIDNRVKNLATLRER